jgi:hypothetical protein
MKPLSRSIPAQTQAPPRLPVAQAFLPVRIRNIAQARRVASSASRSYTEDADGACTSSRINPPSHSVAML